MTPKRIPTRLVPKEEYLGRWRKALDRRAAMERELAARALDPALLLAVQGVIAACDALTIYHRGERAAALRHGDALEVFNRLTNLHGIKEAAGLLARLLRVKGDIEYTGRSQEPQEVRALIDHARKFFAFVANHLPPSQT